MTWRDKVVEALRTGFVLNERVVELARKIERLDQDVRDIDRRVIRIEAVRAGGKNYRGSKACCDLRAAELEKASRDRLAASRQQISISSVSVRR